MHNREFLMLAKNFDSKIHIGGWYVSEKLDGVRAFWDGGVSRGIPAALVPWANTEKDDRLVNSPVATGLWSRYGKVLHAPAWWLDLLPNNTLLDGELYLGRGLFQNTVSIVRSGSGVSDWKEIKYKIFDTMYWTSMFQEGRINNPNFKKIINIIECSKFYSGILTSKSFEDRYSWLTSYIGQQTVCQVVKQERLPLPYKLAMEKLEAELDSVLSSNGEGLIIKNPSSFWEPRRSDQMMKYKPFHDDECVVKSIVLGSGKHEGRMGSLEVSFDGKIFFIGTGFSDSERALTYFRTGDVITFRYRELTDAGIPKEARFLRKYIP